jgi:hypothetical protein
MARFVFIFLVLSVAGVSLSAPVVGKPCPFKFVDVDGRTLTASDNVTTVLVLITRAGGAKARLVADRIPERCLGNPSSRMVTVVRFQNTRNRTLQYVLTSMMRRRLNAEGVKLQKRYAAKGLSRNARQDVYAAADFDGQVAAQLGISADSQCNVLVVSANGTLLRQWSDVPEAGDLSAVLP